MREFLRNSLALFVELRKYKSRGIRIEPVAATTIPIITSFWFVVRLLNQIDGFLNMFIWWRRQPRGFRRTLHLALWAFFATLPLKRALSTASSVSICERRMRSGFHATELCNSAKCRVSRRETYVIEIARSTLAIEPLSETLLRVDACKP